MRYALAEVLAFFCLLPIACFSQAQPGAMDKIVQFPAAFFGKIQGQAAGLDRQITQQTEHYLARLAKKEAKLRKRLYRKDSVTAKKLFANNSLDYTALIGRMQSKTTSLTPFTGNSYSPYLDSIKSSLHFLQQNKELLAGGSQYEAQLTASLTQVNQLQNKMQVADQVKQLVNQHKEQIRQTLGQYTHLPQGLLNSYQGYSREAYYYGQQLQNYRAELSDPDKLTKRALGILNQLPAFQQFMKDHSDLAGLFSLPGSGGYGGAQALAGLQTRSMVQQAIQAQVAGGGPNAQQVLGQNIQSAQTQLKNLKDKINGLGGGSSSMDIPDFRPNPQHTRPFLRRLETGFNIQSVRSTYAFPVTTDIGLSLGYKLNDKSMVGLGASYKMGWGKDIQHIAVSSQGVGLRSFAETKIKGSFFVSGGFEYNYQQPIYSFSQIRSLSSWTRSGLIGVTKKYKINSKWKGKLQLLWDFLSYQQVPRTQAVIFRIGYNL